MSMHMPIIQITHSHAHLYEMCFREQEETYNSPHFQSA